jgi:hypothetical protein
LTVMTILLPKAFSEQGFEQTFGFFLRGKLTG